MNKAVEEEKTNKPLKMNYLLQRVPQKKKYQAITLALTYLTIFYPQKLSLVIKTNIGEKQKEVKKNIT